jgi:hypothetical protein
MIPSILAYEKGHQRPPLTVYTFQTPAEPNSQSFSSNTTPVVTPILGPQSPQVQGMDIWIVDSVCEFICAPAPLVIS